MPETAANARPPELCDYAIERELSAGATYLAVGPNGRRVVLKELDDDCLLQGQLHPMIKDRLERIRELAHPGIANLVTVTRDGGRAFVVWEHVEGVTLRDHLESSPAETRASIGRRLRSSVQGLHRLGIVHGALHGGNVIIAPDGELILTHASPLLYTDPDVDLEAVRGMVSDLGSPAGHEQSGVTVQARRPGASRESPRRGTAPHGARHGSDGRDRGRSHSLIAAAVATLAGGSLSFGIWCWADRATAQPDRVVVPAEPASPAGRTEGGDR